MVFVRIRVATEGFSKALRKVGESAKRFGVAFNYFTLKTATPAYAAAHNGRLPGSERTARLRVVSAFLVHSAMQAK